MVPILMSIEDELAAVSRKIARHRRAIEELTPGRDELIRAAIAENIPRRRIVELTGLAPQRVDQIRRSSRV